MTRTATNTISEISYNEEACLLHVKILEKVDIKHTDMVAHLSSVREITGNNKHVVLVDCSNYFKIQPESLLTYSLKKTSPNRIATAFYNINQANGVIMSFFKNYYEPEIPVELFESREEALQWLNELKQSCA
jgi:hypothetical protein